MAVRALGIAARTSTFHKAIAETSGFAPQTCLLPIQGPDLELYCFRCLALSSKVRRLAAIMPTIVSLSRSVMGLVYLPKEGRIWFCRFGSIRMIWPKDISIASAAQWI